jgi:myo-inositol-1(or 4)-monophosphatase
LGGRVFSTGREPTTWSRVHLLGEGHCRTDSGRWIAQRRGERRGGEKASPVSLRLSVSAGSFSFTKTAKNRFFWFVLSLRSISDCIQFMDPLDLAIAAARAAGTLLRTHFGTALNVNALEAHDIKLELDVQSQALITRMVLDQFSDHAIYGEEGIAGNQSSAFHWIIDPIDGTVNFFYGIPHFCISIALREHAEIVLGVIYDPIRDEMWEVRKGGPALLNGKPCAVSKRTTIPDMAYVASGRLDAYIEQSVSLWDIAAGILLVEAAGGSVKIETRADNPDKFSVVATNGLLAL